MQIDFVLDGNLLAEDEFLSIEQANEFSSSLVFTSIRSSHSGLYHW